MPNAEFLLSLDKLCLGLADRLISIRIFPPLSPLFLSIVAYLAIHGDLWPPDSAKPASRSGGHDLVWTESVLAAHQENTKDKWICCFFTDKLLWAEITVNWNDLMTQILGIETLMKIYTFQENKNISLFYMENKLCGLFGGQFLHLRLVGEIEYICVSIICQTLGRWWPCHISFCDNQGAGDGYSQICITDIRREISNLREEIDMIYRLRL